MKLGVTLESLGLPFRRGLAEARRLGLAGLQVDAVGELAPDRLTDTGEAAKILHLLRSHGLELTALGCPLRHGLDEPANLQQRIDRVRQVMTMSFELGALAGRDRRKPAGEIPDDPAEPKATVIATKACGGARAVWRSDRGDAGAEEPGWNPGATLKAPVLGLPRHRRPRRQLRSGEPADERLRPCRKP